MSGKGCIFCNKLNSIYSFSDYCNNDCAILHQEQLNDKETKKETKEEILNVLKLKIDNLVSKIDFIYDAIIDIKSELIKR